MTKKTYHSAKTGKFVSKEFVKANPDETVEITSINLREEFVKFFDYIIKQGIPLDNQTINQLEEEIDEYLDKNKQ